MLKLISRWLNIYEDEIGLFMWSMILLFLIRSSGIIFNNFAETAFLKRFGVEYLPIVYMINSIATFIIMGLIAGIMARLPGARLLSYLLVFCGATVAGLRFLIPFGFSLLYPILFVLKAQYEILLGLLFWNLANDLFNTRQSKRLFPLITAGGVMGDIIGSFGTPILAKIISIDNLMLIYLVTTMLGALTVRGLGSRFPTILIADKKAKRAKGKKRPGIIEEIKKIIPLMKESTLVKILILLTFLPNIIVPIMNYQFNFAINDQFATEGGIIAFFGYFRGSMNVISLFILLFVGRAYGRLGLPVVLMFHPFNYILAFLAFLFRFDIFSAMYARLSTNVLRTTFNKPATAVLMGLFPESHRAIMRAFLRGTVVRVGLLLSSGIILISENFFHPRYLSLVAIPVVSAWILTAISLKKSYSKILLNLISTDTIDLKALEETDLEQLFSGGKIESQLVQTFLDSSGKRSLWYARLLKSLEIKNLDQHLLTALKHQKDSSIRTGLLELLSSKTGKEAAHMLMEIAASDQNQDVILAALKAANRVDLEFSKTFDYESCFNSQHPEIKACALIGLYQQEPEKYNPIIYSHLQSDTVKDRQTGVIAAGESGDKLFTDRLKEMLGIPENETIVPDILNALFRLKEANLNDLALPYLTCQTARVRLSALSVLEINNDELVKKVISMLGDPSEDVAQMAKQKIETAPYQNIQHLVESLAIPNRKVRKNIFELLESLNIKDLDIFRFAHNQIQDSYQYLSDAVSLEAFPENDSRDLLMDHFNQKKLLRIENILRILALQDTSGKMKIIYRGIFSPDTRKRANAMEALESMMDKRLFKEMIPLVESSSPEESLNFGKKRFQLIGMNSGEKVFLSHLLSYNDWVTVALTLDLIRNHKPEQFDSHIVSEFVTSENKYIRWTARKIMDKELKEGAIA